MQAAATELLDLGPAGLQLTPGCAPTPAFAAWIDYYDVKTRTHDGFSWVRPRQKVWDDGELRVSSDSVHPPVCGTEFGPWVEGVAAAGVTVEVMYPGWLLGSDDELRAVMRLGVPLAIDVSHLYLQVAAGSVTSATLRQLFDYPHVAEVHVSDNDGRADRHWPLTTDSYGLDWAAERAAEGVPVICESYLHRTSTDDRRRLMDVLNARGL
jgi:hypothetical protein